MRVRLIVAGLAVLLAMAACGKSETELKADAELRQRTELRKPVLAHMKDPNSATFRNESLHPNPVSTHPVTRLPLPGVNRDVLCGEYNSKNAMGGYTGYTRFITKEGNFVDLEGGGLFPIDKNERWELTASLEEISKGYNVLIADQKRSLGLRIENKTPEATGFEKRWAEYCV